MSKGRWSHGHGVCSRGLATSSIGLLSAPDSWRFGFETELWLAMALSHIIIIIRKKESTRGRYHVGVHRSKQAGNGETSTGGGAGPCGCAGVSAVIFMQRYKEVVQVERCGEVK